jgi:hypothetical protein
VYFFGPFRFFFSEKFPTTSTEQGGGFFLPLIIVSPRSPVDLVPVFQDPARISSFNFIQWEIEANNSSPLFEIAF